MQIEEMDVLKSAHAHDVARIASLKRKLDRATRRKYELRGQNFSDDEDLFNTDEDPSVVTEADSTSSGVSVRNALEKPKKQTRFKRSVEEEV